MIREGNDEEYYGQATDTMLTNKRLWAIFASKTPVLFLHKELNSTNRAEYYRAIINCVENELLVARYLFALDPTSERLLGLFSSNEKVRTPNWEHLFGIKKLIDNKMIDLRYSDTTNFTSGLVTDKIGMIHFKPPGSLKTKKVDFVTDHNLVQYKNSFISLFNSLPKIDTIGFWKLILNVRDKFGKKEIRSEIMALASKFEIEQKKTDAIFKVYLKLMESMQYPASEEIKRMINYLADYVTSAEQEIFSKIIFEVLDSHPLQIPEEIKKRKPKKENFSSITQNCLVLGVSDNGKAHVKTRGLKKKIESRLFPVLLLLAAKRKTGGEGWVSKKDEIDKVDFISGGEQIVSDLRNYLMTLIDSEKPEGIIPPSEQGEIRLNLEPESIAIDDSVRVLEIDGGNRLLMNIRKIHRAIKIRTMNGEKTNPSEVEEMFAKRKITRPRKYIEKAEQKIRQVLLAKHAVEEILGKKFHNEEWNDNLNNIQHMIDEI